MNQKELNEIRRRFRLDKNNFSRIFGCYVNSNREVISWIDTSLGLMRQEEQEMYLGLLKKTLSGTLGRNLIDIEFSTAQVADSDEHRLLMRLRDSGLEDEEAVQALYEKIAGSLHLADNYLILLAADRYDVPFRSRDGFRQDEGSEQQINMLQRARGPFQPPAEEKLFRNEQHAEKQAPRYEIPAGAMPEAGEAPDD